jgi:hypothetical protein
MRFASLAILFLSAFAAAQDRVAAKLVSDPFLESYQPEVSVSGNVIVGVMTATAAAAMLNDQVAIRSDGLGDQTVCLRVTSRDGIYSSRNIYALPDGTAGSVLLPYRSKLADVVQAYAADEIAMAATAGECESGSADYFLLSGAAETGVAEIVVYLNSFGATDVFYQLASDPVPCEYITEGRRTTFDFICRLGVVDTGDTIPVTFIRERFGREQPSIEVQIVGAGR